METDCTTFDGPGGAGRQRPPYRPPRRPGTLNFVPNNVEPVNSATPGATVKARYYDVTLRNAGTTHLSQRTVTIDRLTLDGTQAKLDVRPGGTLNVWGDYTQMCRLDQRRRHAQGRRDAGRHRPADRPRA